MPRQQIVCQFTVSDIAELCGCSNPAIFHHIRQGTLVLEDLVSVVKFLAAKAKDDVRVEIGMAYGRVGSYGPPVGPSKKADAQAAAEKKITKTKKRITRISG